MIPLLKKKLEDNGYIVDEPTPNVIVVENFLSDSELKEIHDIIKNTTEEDWMIEYTQNLKRFCLEKFGREDVDNLVAEGKFEITLGWEDKNYNMANDPIAQNIVERVSKFISAADDK